jgi:hypothetical protein
MRLPELKHLTESEYLELEKKASIKHELFFIIDGKTKRQKMPPFRE